MQAGGRTAATPKITTSLPLAVRVGIAVAIAVVLSLAWKGAERSSHEAVQVAQAMLSRSYVTLPRVEVVGHREPVATPVAARAAAKRQG